MWAKANRWMNGLLLKISGGDNDWYPLVREVAHFLGGCLVGAGGYGLSKLLGVWGWIGTGAALFGVLLWMEVGDQKTGQSRLKTLVDLLAWSLGFFLVFGFTS